MKHNVRVTLNNGCTGYLDREQVEDALAELNVASLKHLDRVIRRHDPYDRGIVIVGEAQKHYAKGYGLSSEFTAMVICENGKGHSYTGLQALADYWRLETSSEDEERS